uniref:Small integral membrane protein 32 n=2 Tax=Oreochromis TaxID=8139 RepID=A0A669DHY8_ORENI
NHTRRHMVCGGISETIDPPLFHGAVAALLRPTTGRGGGELREGELHKPDLITYIVMCLLLFLLVLLIVFFINCQLRNSFFASMPYDRSLREARTSYK